MMKDTTRLCKYIFKELKVSSSLKACFRLGSYFAVFSLILLTANDLIFGATLLQWLKQVVDFSLLSYACGASLSLTYAMTIAFIRFNIEICILAITGYKADYKEKEVTK